MATPISPGSTRPPPSCPMRSPAASPPSSPKPSSPTPWPELPGSWICSHPCKDQPIRILATAPSMVSISTAARGISPAALESLLAREDILGLGESYWQAVLQEPDVYLPAYAADPAIRKSPRGAFRRSQRKKACRLRGRRRVLLPRAHQRRAGPDAPAPGDARHGAGRQHPQGSRGNLENQSSSASTCAG